MDKKVRMNRPAGKMRYMTLWGRGMALRQRRSSGGWWKRGKSGWSSERISAVSGGEDEWNAWIAMNRDKISSDSGDEVRGLNAARRRLS